MLSFLLAFLTVVRVFVRSRADTALEVLALRQQLGVLKRKRRRPRLSAPDRDSIFDADVIAFLKVTGLGQKRTSRQSPWQNGTAERWIGSCRREMLDHVIAVNEEHLRRLIRDYARYYHEDSIHDSLGKDTPNRWSVETKPADASLISLPRLGGLHHRYAWRRAA